jgi:hypothetical protein
MGKIGFVEGAKRAESGATVARKTKATIRKIGHLYLLRNMACFSNIKM